MSPEPSADQVAVISSTKAFKYATYATGVISMVLGALTIALSTIWFSNLESASRSVYGAFALSLVTSIVQVKGTLVLLFCGLQRRLEAFVIVLTIAFLGSSILLTASLHNTVNAKALLHMSYGQRLLEEGEATAVIITAGLNMLFNSGLVLAYIINRACIPVSKEVPYSIML